MYGLVTYTVIRLLYVAVLGDETTTFAVIVT
jgi:hypothetical protein